MTSEEIIEKIRPAASDGVQPLEIRLKGGRVILLEELLQAGMTYDRQALTLMLGPCEENGYGLFEDIEIDRIESMTPVKPKAAGQRKRAS